MVSIEDAGGKVVPTDTASVTLAIASGTISTGTGTGGAALTCTSNPAAASGGIAGFVGCSINPAGGGYTLTAAGSGVTSATSAAFTET